MIERCEWLSGVTCDRSYGCRSKYRFAGSLLSLADVDGDDWCGLDVLFCRAILSSMLTRCCLLHC